MYDFYDYNSKYLSKHSRERIAIYEREEFEVKRHYNSVRKIAKDDDQTKKLMDKFWE